MPEPWETLPIDPNEMPILLGKMAGCEYELGAKANPLDQQLADIKAIDCSGLTKVLIFKACGEIIPDGSANQLAWLKAAHFKPSSIQAGKLKDGILRMFVLPQQPGQGVGRHTGFILNGKTLESYGGHGPGRRSWTGRAYQSKCQVFVLAYPTH